MIYYSYRQFRKDHPELDVDDAMNEYFDLIHHLIIKYAPSGIRIGYDLFWLE